MPKYRNRSAKVAFFTTSNFSGKINYASGGIPGKKSTFDTASNDDNKFEELMEIQADLFNHIQRGANLNLIDFSNLIILINDLAPKFSYMKNFLIDTLTVVNLARTYFNKAVNLAEQLDILQDEYDKLLKKYQWLEEHSMKLKQDVDTDTSLTFCTNVEVDMDMVYILYQHFFGYPIDGIWDEERANMIRKHLQNREITSFKENGKVVKIRHINDTIKIELQSAPGVILEMAAASVGDILIQTNMEETNGVTEVNYGLKIGQIIIIGYGGPNPESRIIVGFGSIIINKPLEYAHPQGAILYISGQSGIKYLSGIIISINGNFESYDIKLDIGGIVKNVSEIVLEEGKVYEPYIPPVTSDNNEYICLPCGSNSCDCKCEICCEVLNKCNCK